LNVGTELRLESARRVKGTQPAHDVEESRPATRVRGTAAPTPLRFAGTSMERAAGALVWDLRTADRGHSA
jgi:hypothetical protein